MNKIRIMFLDNSQVEFDRPDGFDLPMFIHGIRSIGMVLGKGFYVPLGLVKCVIDLSEAVNVTVMGPTTPPTQTAPSTETKQ